MYIVFLFLYFIYPNKTDLEVAKSLLISGRLSITSVPCFCATCEVVLSSVETITRFNNLEFLLLLPFLQLIACPNWLYVFSFYSFRATPCRDNCVYFKPVFFFYQPRNFFNTSFSDSVIIFSLVPRILSTSTILFLNRSMA